MLGLEWHLATSGLDMITDNGTIADIGKIYESALNYDLKEICSPVLVHELPKEILLETVLQIQKIRNISAPKSKEDSQAAPRMLKLTLTDGDTFIQAIETSPIGSISRNHTPPGSKILINKARIVSGYLLLTASNCKLLGGKVPHLVEKWELSKSVKRHHGRNSSEDEPPPWVSFGKRLQAEFQEKNFDSLGKSKEAKENFEFENQRQSAIAEASNTAIPKVFGGRVKQNIQVASGSTTAFDRNSSRRDQGKIRSRNQPREQEDTEIPSKPSDKLSLFSFLEDKLPSSDSKETGGKYTSSDNKNKYYHKYNNVGMAMNYQTDKSYQHSYSGNWVNKSENNISNMAHSHVKQTNQLDKPHACTLAKPNNYHNDNNHQHFLKNNINNKPNSTNYRNNQHYEKPHTNIYKDNMQKTFTRESKFQPKTKPNYDLNAKNTDLLVSPDQQAVLNFIEPTEVPEEIPNIGKLSLNTQFASRSLRQHLNLGAGKKTEDIAKETGPSNKDSNGHQWKVGDDILAKYWEDGRFYIATITAVTEKTFAVKFKGYGNIEEIFKHDCRPIQNDSNKSNKNYLENRQRGSMEFRRSNRSYK